MESGIMKNIYGTFMTTLTFLGFAIFIYGLASLPSPYNIISIGIVVFISGLVGTLNYDRNKKFEELKNFSVAERKNSAKGNFSDNVFRR